ncbi:ribosomal protein L6 [Ramicandelaber brevisporus]|nr:ribosomal protein L6 [Ramicandelaber brevisporus]
MLSTPTRVRTVAAVARPQRTIFTATQPAFSRIGRLPIKLSSDVEILLHGKPLPSTLAERPQPDNSPPEYLHVKGPRGELQVPLHPFVRLRLNDPTSAADNQTTPASNAAPAAPSDGILADEPDMAELKISIVDPKVRFQRSMWGTTRALLSNAVRGVTEGVSCPIRLSGIGFRAAVEPIPANHADYLEGANRMRLALKVGFPHLMYVTIPDGITAQVPNPTRIVLRGIDLQQVKELAATIRRIQPPEPYNLKGIFVDGEVIQKKERKKDSKSGGGKKK